MNQRMRHRLLSEYFPEDSSTDRITENSGKDKEADGKKVGTNPLGRNGEK